MALRTPRELRRLTARQFESLMGRARQAATALRTAGFRLAELLYTLFISGVSRDGDVVPAHRFMRHEDFESFAEQELGLSQDCTRMMVRVWERFYTEGGALYGFDTRLRLSITKMYHVSRVARTPTEANDWLRRARTMSIEELNNTIRRMIEDMRGEEGHTVGIKGIHCILTRAEYERWLHFLSFSTLRYGNERRNGVHLMRAVDAFMSNQRRN